MDSWLNVGQQRQLLRCLRFDVDVSHPFAPLLAYADLLCCGRALVQTAWALLTDSYLQVP